ncbi:hypothetical protein JKG47_16360, partial [Acidithiobacillus sp. MC6.1]|nr:hypothetical protein [Acidithiobacillus sp. MC6.1]
MDKEKLTSIAIYGVPAIVIGGMMVWHLHWFGLGETSTAAARHAGPASFVSAPPAT